MMRELCSAAAELEVSNSPPLQDSQQFLHKSIVLGYKRVSDNILCLQRHDNLAC